MTEDDAMADEFDTVAGWTRQAVAELGEDHALPAACQGSASPAALDWLATSMGLRQGLRLLDSGAGVGGPAEHAARSYGVRPTLAEPMEGACRAARRLFDHPVVVSDGLALPFPDATFDAAWSLGVLCTIEDKRAYLAELRRAVVAGRRGRAARLHARRRVPARPAGGQLLPEPRRAAWPTWTPRGSRWSTRRCSPTSRARRRTGTRPRPGSTRSSSGTTGTTNAGSARSPRRRRSAH